jgi:hypothetical protein
MQAFPSLLAPLFLAPFFLHRLLLQPAAANNVVISNRVCFIMGLGREQWCQLPGDTRTYFVIAYAHAI